MTTESLIKQNRYFFISYLILLIFGLFILLTYSKVDGFILMNPVHHRPLDYFFIVATYLGDGIFIIALALLLFFLKKRSLSLMIVLSYALSGIFVQIIKYFYHSARPGKLLEGMEYHNFVEGVTLHTLNSFPSGHTTSAFALAAILGFVVKNKNYSIVFLLVAAIIGYSRIYLGQHFMADVLAGSVIGVLSAIILEILLKKWSEKLFQKK